MFPLYLKILALNLGISNFAVLIVALASGRTVKAGDFLLPAAIQFLLVTLIFLVLDLLRAHVRTPRAGEKLPEAGPATSLAARQGTRRGFHTSTSSASQLEVPSFGAAQQNSAKG